MMLGSVSSERYVRFYRARCLNDQLNKYIPKHPRKVGVTVNISGAPQNQGGAGYMSGAPKVLGGCNKVFNEQMTQ